MIAKRNLVVYRAELARLFNLPEGVEILAVRANKGYDDGFEFLLASAEEVDGVTVITDEDIGNIRRLSLGRLRELAETVEDEKPEQKDDEARVTNVTINMNNGIEDKNKIVNEIAKGLRGLEKGR